MPSDPTTAAGRAPGCTTGTIACVVDAPGRFHDEALRWFASLTRIAGVAPADLVVHAVGPPADPAVLAHLAGQGVSVRPVAPFDTRSPHCNKIAGALSLVEHRVRGPVVLTDVDVAVLEDPRRVPVAAGSLAARPVDEPNPPNEVLAAVFAAAGVRLPGTVPLEWAPGASTVAGNANGGLYLLAADDLAGVARAWAHWAAWLLDRRDLLARWGLFVDQVAMALALAAEGIDAVALAMRWNLPTQIPVPPATPAPAVIHYHRKVDQAGAVRRTGAPEVDRCIARVNEVTAAERAALGRAGARGPARPAGPLSA